MPGSEVADCLTGPDAHELLDLLGVEERAQVMPPGSLGGSYQGCASPELFGVPKLCGPAREAELPESLPEGLRRHSCK